MAQWAGRLQWGVFMKRTGSLRQKDWQQMLSPDSPWGVRACASPRAPCCVAGEGDGDSRLCQGPVAGPFLHFPVVTWGYCLFCAPQTV